MKQLKKSLSLLLALVMLVSVMALPVSAAAYPDVEGSKYEKAINLVSALGIMTGYEDGTFAPDQPLTRAEYCMVLCRMLGLNDALDSITYVFFEDVLEEHWAAKAISVIFSLGYANGYGNGNFGPEHSVLYQDAVKMTVNALGYGFMAGGVYPDGYMTVASENGLLKGISEVGSQPITRGALAQLVYNALNLELLEEVYTTDGIGFEKGDETLLTRTFKAIKGEGQVTANGTTNILGNNPAGKDEVRIGGVLYKVGTTNAADCLGYNVLYYYTVNDDGQNVLLMCEVKSATNKTIVLDAEQVATHTSNVASGSISYYATETATKVTVANIAQNPSVLYNGKKVSAVTDTGATNPDYSLNVLLPDNGTVTLIDNDNDSIYDVIDIKAISTMVVNGIDKNKGYVYLKADAELQPETSIDFSLASDKNYNFSLIKDGEEIEFKNLQEWDVLSVMKSLDGMSYTMYVSSTAVNGYISRVARNDQGGMGAITIEGVEYDVVPDYYFENIDTGLTGTFYLDYTGKVAAYDKSSSGTARYVYLMAVDNQSTRLTTDVSIKVCTTAGSFATYALNEKISYTGYLNGAWVTDKKVEAVDVATNGLTTDGKVNDQLIIIGTDDQNKITEIQTASDIKTAGDDYDEELFSQDLDWTKRYGSTATTTGFKLPKSRDTVGQEAVLPNSSPVFIVTRVEGENSIAENRIGIKYRRDESLFNDSGDMDLYAYDVSSGGSIPVAVLYTAQKAAAIDNYRVESGVKLMMVNEVVQMLNEDGDPVTAIVGLSNGQATEIIPSANKLTRAQPDSSTTLHYMSYLDERAVAAGDFSAIDDPWALLGYMMPGDLFWYNTDADGYMSIYQPLLGRLEYAKNEDGSVDSSKLELYKPNGNVAMPNNQANNSTVGYRSGWDAYAESLELFGTAYDKDPSTNTFKYRCKWNNQDGYILANYCGGFVCVYDVETETFKTGSLADMVTEKQAGEYANKVLVHTEYSYPDWVLIYQ